MPNNRGGAYIEPGKVEVRSIEYPKLKVPAAGAAVVIVGGPDPGEFGTS